MIAKDIGQIIPGLQINGKPAPYGVLNERSIRATAGIMFAVGFFTMMYTFFTQDFTILKIVVTTFFFDFLVKVLWGPKYSPIAFLGKKLFQNKNQNTFEPFKNVLLGL